MIHIKKRSSHRNGVAGARFDVCIFTSTGGDWERGTFIAIAFDEPFHTAVFDLKKLCAGDIAFGSNSWRGDDLDKLLRAAIDKETRAQYRAEKGVNNVKSGE